MNESHLSTSYLHNSVPKQFTILVWLMLPAIAIAFTGGTIDQKIGLGTMSRRTSSLVERNPSMYFGRMVEGNNNNNNKFNKITTELDASSLFLDIPDIQTLQAAATVIASGVSSGVGVSWMMDRAASGFRRRFFVRKQMVEGADSSEIPREYRIANGNYQPTTTTTTTTASTMKTTEELRRIIQERKKKLALPNLLFPNEQRSNTVSKSPYAEQVVDTSVNPWSTTSTPPAPQTASFLTEPYSPSFAPVPATGRNYLENIAGVTATKGAKKKFYGPSKWSPDNPSTKPISGSTSSYLATMSNPSTSSYSSPPVSYGLPTDKLTTTTTTTPTFSGASSYLSNMSGPSSSSVPTNYGKKSYSPSKWSPNSSTTSSSGSGNFAGGNTYFSQMSSPSSSTTTQSFPSESSIGSIPTSAPDTTSYSLSSSSSAAAASTGTYTDQLGGGRGSSSSNSPKSYSMSKWSPKSKVATSGTGVGGYFSNFISSDSSSSYQSTSYEPSPYDSPPTEPPSTSPVDNTYSSSAKMAVSTGSYMNQLGGGEGSSSTTVGARKSYSMSKWSPKSTSTGTGMTGYLSNMSSDPKTIPPPPPTPPSSTSYSTTSAYQSTTSASYEPPPYNQQQQQPLSAPAPAPASYLSMPAAATGATVKKWGFKSSSGMTGSGSGGYFSSLSSSSSSSSSASMQEASNEIYANGSYNTANGNYNGANGNYYDTNDVNGMYNNNNNNNNINGNYNNNVSYNGYTSYNTASSLSSQTTQQQSSAYSYDDMSGSRSTVVAARSGSGYLSSL